MIRILKSRGTEHDDGFAPGISFDDAGTDTSRKAEMSDLLVDGLVVRVLIKNNRCSTSFLCGFLRIDFLIWRIAYDYEMLVQVASTSWLDRLVKIRRSTPEDLQIRKSQLTTKKTCQPFKLFPNLPT